MKTSFPQKGVAAVEFGLLLVPLVTLAFGITEYGRAMYQYNAIAKGARDAVRLLSQTSPADLAYGNSTTAAKCLAVYGNTGCTGNVLVSGLTVNKVAVLDRISDPGTHGLQPVTGPDGVTGVANLVTVQVSGYQFTSLVSFVAPNITFNNISATMVQPL